MLPITGPENDMEYESLDRALVFAARRHRKQRRDGENALPYFTHPVEVLLCLRYEGSVIREPMLCAAILHDLLEETKTQASEIEARFGAEVAHLVRELTRREPSAQETEGLGKEEIYRLRTDWLLQEISAMSPEAKTIKLADRLANLRDARRSRRGTKLERYQRQTRAILQVIPRETNANLWDAIHAEIPRGQ